MEHGAAQLTVLFEDPFWIGIYQRESTEGVRVCKILFGPEPKDYEVYDYLLHNWSRLSFSPSIEGVVPTQRRGNPKRMQREIRKQVSPTGIGTKAQQALQKQREESKKAKQSHARQRREEEAARRFQLRQEKRKEKHRGR